MKKQIKKIIAPIIMSFIFTVQPLSVYADSSDLLYEDKNIQTITSGVTYEKSSRLYKAGWLDVYVLTVDTKNPNVAFEVIESVSELGLKQSVETLAKDNGVIAAVNGDFFGSGNPKSSMGIVMKDGKLDEAQNYYNGNENKYAGLFIDNSATPFIDYVKTQIGFYNSSESVIELQAKNKFTDFSKPVYFDRDAITSTAKIDGRVKNLTKIVVQNGEIIKISSPGEIVDIPENGYVIVMSKAVADEKIKYYSIGQKVSFTENSTFVFRPQKKVSEINFGISGGGELLRNGEVISTGLIIGKNQRNPRTLVGVDKDKTKVIIMVIDGRKNGIGATHVESANLMKEYGAYDAIHFDGGGSTTFVVRNENKNDINVNNIPSEGNQRQVANAIGIKSTNEHGELASINIVADNHEDNRILKGALESFSVFGYDSNHNPVPLNLADVSFEAAGVNGTWSGNVFTPLEEGKAVITARSKDVTGQLEVNVISEGTSIQLYTASKTLVVGESTNLTTTVLNKDGYGSKISHSSVSWTVGNPEVGYVEDGKFFATKDGNATVIASYNGSSSSVNIGVGKIASTVTSFEEPMELKMVYYPEDKGITGGAGITNSQAYAGGNSLLLSYNFAPNSTVTQAAYVSFENQPLNLASSPTDISLWAKGDGSGNMLKMVIKDANDAEYPVTLFESMDFNDWKYASIAVPRNVKYPIRIDKFYVASLQTTDNTSGAVYIDNVSQLAPAQPAEDKQENFKDYMNVDLSGPKAENEEDITIFGQTANKNENSDSVIQNVLNKMQYGANAMLFVGMTDINNTTGVNSVRWNNKYETTGTENFSIVNLATHNGSIRTSSPDQWRWFQGFLRDFSKNNIIINMDRDVWGSGANALNDYKEANLLHKILKEFVADTGKNVIVVSATGYSTKVTVKDGVRYINLNGLTASNPNDLSSYKYLRIRADENSMRYQIQNVY